MKISIAVRAACCAALCMASLSAQVMRTNPGFHADSVARNDDGSSQVTQLGFNINFFGKIRNSVYVNNNGNITFDNALVTYTPFGLANTSREIIAPFFADVDTRGARSALVSYGHDTVNGHNAFAANYVDVGYFHSHDDKLNRFQVVVIDRTDTGAGNFNIEFNYERILWETGDASGGTAGFGGVPATVGWSNGTSDPGTSFELPGSMIAGSLLDSGPKALVRAHLNTSQVGRLLFQARDGVISPGLSIQGGPILPDATVGQPYSFALAAVGAVGTVTWDLAPDIAMPAGITFFNGKLSGQPAAPGTFGFTVSATANVDGESVTIFERAALTVDVSQLAIVTACPVPQGTVGQLYSAAFSTAGNSGASWSVEDRNSLPPGLTLSASGILGGAPSAAGNYSFTVRVSAKDGLATLPAQKACMLMINPAAVRLASGCAMPSATVGVPYSQSLTMDGGVGPYRFALVGQLPLGLGLTPEGQIVGLPQFADSEAFQIQITDSRANTMRQSCTIGVVDPSVSIRSVCPLPKATTGTPYTASLAASGGTGPYTWSVSGTLPPGLTFGPGEVVSGRPMSAGPYKFRLLATDVNGQQSGSACSIAVLYGPLAISDCPLPEATVGDTYRAVLTPAGGSQPFTWSSRGSLPPGLQLSREGVVQGKVTAAGDFDFSLGLSDGSAMSVTQACSLKVKPLALRLSTIGAAPAARLGEAYSTHFSAEGGTPPYRFEFSGYLPEGLAGSSGGTVSGTPTAAGTTSFGIRITDSSGGRADSSSSIQVGLPSLPGLRISAMPATVPAASAGVTIGVELDRSYTLPISGQLALSLSSDTKSLDANANQPDPHVRFLNGQLISNFQIPAGAKRVTVPLLSTGTVAATMTVSVRGLRAGEVDFAAPVVPSIFRVTAAPPVVNSACFVKDTVGVHIKVLGSSTTRELVRGEVTVGSIVGNTDLSGASSDYFAGDGSIHFGGAFTLQFDADSSMNLSTGPFSVRLSNTVGWSGSLPAQKCQ